MDEISDLPSGVVVRMLKQADNSNYLVLADRDGQPDQYSRRVAPVIWFDQLTYRKGGSRILHTYHPRGFYLVAARRQRDKPLLLDGCDFQQRMFHALNCVRKELVVKFAGKVGPLNAFAPRRDVDGRDVRGFYSGYATDTRQAVDSERADEVPPMFGGEFRMEDVGNGDVRRLGVVVGEGGKCVCIELKMTAQEERQRRSGGSEYHHNRLLVLENGFFLFDGVFTWKPINSYSDQPIDVSGVRRPVIFLGRGVHLITSQRQKDHQNNYFHQIEVATSLETENINVLDWAIVGGQRLFGQ